MRAEKRDWLFHLYIGSLPNDCLHIVVECDMLRCNQARSVNESNMPASKVQLAQASCID